MTYEGFAAAWPGQKDEAGFADKMNGMNKYVVSRTLQNAAWNNTTVIRGNVPQEIANLKQQEGQDILVAGSSVLLNTLIENDLVDEYRFLVYPVVLGQGKRLFKEGHRVNLQLREAIPYTTGVIMQRYVPVRADGKQ